MIYIPLVAFGDRVETFERDYIMANILLSTEYLLLEAFLKSVKGI